MAVRAGLTYEDYLKLPDDGNRYEILDGELYVTPAPGTEHQAALANLFGVLHPHVRRGRLGVIFFAPVDVLFPGAQPAQPDLVFVRRERRAIVTRRAIEGVPDLIVEALSPTTEKVDRGKKYQIYERAGVPHYWLVDAAERTIEEYLLEEGRYRLAQRRQDNATFFPALFPGLEIPLAALWLDWEVVDAPASES